ncbi:MAG: hypothetical protein AAF409_18970 [Pseudomonadota bacterium]
MTRLGYLAAATLLLAACNAPVAGTSGQPPAPAGGSTNINTEGPIVTCQREARDTYLAKARAAGMTVEGNSVTATGAASPDQLQQLHDEQMAAFFACQEQAGS